MDTASTTDAVIIENPDSLVTTEDTRLRDAIRALDRAEADYAANVTNSPLALGDRADAIRAELESRHRPALDEARDRALRAAESVRANARAVTLQTEHAEYVLTDAEMASANARRAFIAEDVETLSYPRLVDALRFAVTKGDKSAMYVYAREIPKRLNRDRDTPSWSDATAQADREALRNLLTTVDAALRDRSLEPLNKRATELMVRAGELRDRIEKPRMAERRYAFQSANEVSW